MYRNTNVVISNVYRLPIWNHAGDHRIDHFEAENVLGRCLLSSDNSQHIIGGDFNPHHAGYGWGGHSRENRAGYFAFVHSQLIHNSSVYFPFLSATNMKTLERIQNTGARVITGLPKATIINE
jgi:hypothetical protein